MAEKVHNTTQSLVNDFKSGLHGIHGAGEALRGGAMEALDGVFHKKEGEAKDHEIYDRGLAEMRGIEERFESKHQQHDATVAGSGHSHPAEHGQGSHFAGIHANGVPHQAANTVSRDESVGAAKIAWQEKH